MTDGESAETYVERLVEKASKSEVSRILASSADAFHTAALASYLTRFDFTSDPLDIALRKFLMEAALPTETQQIDRVMEAFAIRYNECNPGLWTTSDTPYVLAFSLVMLSTDQFNPSNKSKMSKADYVKNARIDGVPVEVLEYFFDQITITPFVFVEEDISSPQHTAQRPELLQQSTSSSFFSKSTSQKIDPYHTISLGQTGDLRVDVAAIIPAKSPFSFTGTTSFFNATTLHQNFARAPILQITNGRNRSKSSAAPIANSKPIDGAPLTVVTSNMTYAPPKEKYSVSSLKITKVGVLSRKDDLAEGGRKSSSRKWRGWSVILTGSQLLFFKETAVAASVQQTLNAALASAQPHDDPHGALVNYPSAFKPDAVHSLANSAAIYDSSYNRYNHVFRLVAPAGRQYLFQARDEDDLNSWLAHINYAASFKTANLRIRSLASKKPAGSPSSPISFGLPSPRSPPWSTAVGSLSSSLGSAKSTSKQDSSPPPPLPVDAPLPLSPVTEEDPAALPQSLVDALKTGIINSDSTPMPSVRRPDAEDYGFPRVPVSSGGSAGSASPTADHQLFDRGPITRAEVLRARIASLEDEIAIARAALQADLCLARNFAVLTPFRSSTRERIASAIRPLVDRVRQSRMTLAKLVCYREVLARDLLADDRENQRSRKTSHQRINSLTRHSSLNRPSSPLNTSQRGATPSKPTNSPTSGPRTSAASSSNPSTELRDSLDSEVLAEDPHDVSEHEGDPAEDGNDDDDDDDPYNGPGGRSLTDDELDRLRSPPMMQRSQTETTGARLRAVSSATSDDDLDIPAFLRRHRSSGPSTPLAVSSPPISAPLTLSEEPEHTPVMEIVSSLPTIDAEGGGSSPSTEEVAEDWTNTRAAKRVSLVDYEKLDERGLSSLMRIREERRSENASSSEAG